MGKVYITDYIVDPSIERGILGDSLVQMPSSDVEALLVWHQKIDEAYIQQFPKLRAVIRYGVGYDGLDLVALKAKNIMACNTPDYGTAEVGDTALAMILNACRGISYYDFSAKRFTDGTWQENVIGSLKRVSELTVGVVGAGRIGSSLIRKLEAIGFKTAFYDPYREDGYEKIFSNSRRCDSLEELLAISDLVSMHTPLNEKTKGMINPQFLAAMKPGATLVNTSRGGIVASLDDLVPFLKSGHLHSVALDVIPSEPPDENSELIKIWKGGSTEFSARIVINPHTAYYSQQAFIEMRTKAAENARRALEGKPLKYKLL